MKTALVTGAAGFVGSFVTRELALSGYQVRAMVRPGGHSFSLPDLSPLEPSLNSEALGRISVVEGDITDAHSLEGAFSGCEIIFHIAALYREARFPDSEYFRVNTQGTSAVFSTAAKLGIAQVIHCSTIGVHSHISHPPADEQEPYAPTDVYQVSKMEGEKVALEYFRSGTVGGAVIRPAMIWGPGDTRFLKLFRGISRRKLPIIGNGKVLTHWISVTDLARAFRLAAETASARGEIFIIAGNSPITLEAAFERIASSLGVKLLPWKIPAWPIQLAGSFVEALCRPFGIEPPLHRRRADFFIKNRAFNCEKAKRVLGFQAEHSFEKEVERICRWYRHHRWI